MIAHSQSAMSRQAAVAVEPPALAIRAHDAAASVALGVALARHLLKASPEGTVAAAMFEDALGQLRALERELRGEARGEPADIALELSQHARRLGLKLDLKLKGPVGQLDGGLKQLITMGGREALINASRHSGATAVQISIEAAGGSFEFAAKDWGAGSNDAGKAGRGLSLLDQLAGWLGCELSFASQPGLGTELRITGPWRAERVPARTREGRH